MRGVLACGYGHRFRSDLIDRGPCPYCEGELRPESRRRRRSRKS